MKKAIFIILSPFLLIFLFLLVLSAIYSPAYVYRLVTMNVADVYDYQSFENRRIKAAEKPGHFAKELQEAYVESLFSERVSRSGFSSFNEWAEKSQTTALIIVCRDTIMYEKYFNGFNRESYFHSQSMAKSFISFLIGAAIDDGYIAGINDSVTSYIPELKERDERFNAITIKDLLQMRSGLKYFIGYFPGTYIHLPWHDEAVGYYHNNIRKLLLKKVRVESEAGNSFQYCNYNTSYLGLVLERATGKTVSAYLEEKLWSRIMEYDALFSIDSKKSGFEYMPSRLIARAIDYARFGQLYLYEGRLNGRQIISKDWVLQSTREDESIPRDIYPSWFTDSCRKVYYSYQWWGHMNCDSSFQFAASGNLGQNIYVIPEQEMVIVHCGNSLEHYGDFDLWEIAVKMKSQQLAMVPHQNP